MKVRSGPPRGKRPLNPLSSLSSRTSNAHSLTPTAASVPHVDARPWAACRPRAQPCDHLNKQRAGLAHVHPRVGAGQPELSAQNTCHLPISRGFRGRGSGSGPEAPSIASPGSGPLRSSRLPAGRQGGCPAAPRVSSSERGRCGSSGWGRFKQSE